MTETNAEKLGKKAEKALAKYAKEMRIKRAETLKYLADVQEDTPPEFRKSIDKHFFDLA